MSVRPLLSYLGEVRCSAARRPTEVDWPRRRGTPPTWLSRGGAVAPPPPPPPKPPPPPPLQSSTVPEERRRRPSPLLRAAVLAVAVA